MGAHRSVGAAAIAVARHRLRYWHRCPAFRQPGSSRAGHRLVAGDGPASPGSCRSQRRSHRSDPSRRAGTRCAGARPSRHHRSGVLELRSPELRTRSRRHGSRPGRTGSSWWTRGVHRDRAVVPMGDRALRASAALEAIGGQVQPGHDTRQHERPHDLDALPHAPQLHPRMERRLVGRWRGPMVGGELRGAIDLRSAAVPDRVVNQAARPLGPSGTVGCAYSGVARGPQHGRPLPDRPAPHLPHVRSARCGRRRWSRHGRRWPTPRHRGRPARPSTNRAGRSVRG